MKHVPPPTDGEPLTGLAEQSRERQAALIDVTNLRKQASVEIERLIAFLDACDPYVQAELEEECEDEGAQCEGEGDACEDEGADVENVGEPSLGSLDHTHAQDKWAAGNRSDRELDAAESGIGDQDGLDEQVPFRDWQNIGMV